MERRLKWPPLLCSCPRVVCAWSRRGLEARVLRGRVANTRSTATATAATAAVVDTLSKAYPFFSSSDPMPGVQRLSVTFVQLVCFEQGDVAGNENRRK